MKENGKRKNNSNIIELQKIKRKKLIKKSPVYIEYIEEEERYSTYKAPIDKKGNLWNKVIPSFIIVFFRYIKGIW